jgi:hypothetical protein
MKRHALAVSERHPKNKKSEGNAPFSVKIFNTTSLKLQRNTKFLRTYLKSLHHYYEGTSKVPALYFLKKSVFMLQTPEQRYFSI